MHIAEQGNLYKYCYIIIIIFLELTVGFETNIQNNSDRKAAKYKFTDQ